MRHPWIDVFVRDPVKGFGDLLAGYAKIHPYDRADPPDAARMLFGPLPQDDPAREALDKAIPAWLAQRRRRMPPTDPSRLGQWVAEIQEAFEIVAALDLVDAAIILRRQFVSMNEWTARFCLSSARDARAAYWRMLALTQPIVARSGRINDASGLAPVWLDICRQAGGALPERYLSIGLLGLRRLPAGRNGSEAPWVAGLARWALEQNPSSRRFRAEWHALKPLYPRTPGRWRELVDRLLDTPLFREVENEALDWWRRDIQGGDARARRSAAAAGGRLRSPLPGDCNIEIDYLPNAWTLVEPRIDVLMQRHRAFLGATGDAQFFVRAIHSLGAELIRIRPDEPTARARKARDLAREGLSWVPTNRFLWSLWREALEAEGALEAAELVGWEWVRRDPDHPDARNQLATLLAGPLGRPAQAEALLRDTIATFPADPVARTQLAELLIGSDRIDAAEAEVAAAFAAQAANEVTYAIQARLLSHRGQPRDAMAAVQAGRQIDPTNPALRRYEQTLSEGRRLPLKSLASRQADHVLRGAAIDPETLEAVGPLARMRQLRARIELGAEDQRQSALQDIRETLNEDPTFAYARLLAERYGVVEAGAEAMPGFAIAFERALSDRDQARLAELAEQQPRLEALILLASAMLGDGDAAWSVAMLVNDDPPRDEPVAVTFLRHRLAPLLGQVDKAATIAVIAANDNIIQRWIRDANEATFGDRLLAA